MVTTLATNKNSKKKKTSVMAITHRKNHEDHPEKDLAKSGYKPSMKYKSLITLLYSG
jgi:hypothetical protein